MVCNPLMLAFILFILNTSICTSLVYSNIIFFKYLLSCVIVSGLTPGLGTASGVTLFVASLVTVSSFIIMSFIKVNISLIISSFLLWQCVRVKSAMLLEGVYGVSVV